MLLVISVGAQAGLISQKLTKKETQFALELVNKYEIPTEFNGPYTKTEFENVGRTKGFSPNVWTVSFEEKEE